MEEMRNAHKIVRKPQRREPLKNLGVDWRIILKYKQRITV
jgi:hypothetical protein